MIPWSTRLLRDEDLEAGRGDSLGSDSGQPVTSLVLCRSFLILGPEVNSDWRGQDERGRGTWARPARAPRSHPDPCLGPMGYEDSGHFRAMEYYDVGECPGHSEDHPALLSSGLIFKAGPLTSPPHSQSPVLLRLHYPPLTWWLF